MFKHQPLIESWVGHSLHPNSRGEAMIQCPNSGHEDTHASCSVNCDTGLCYCFGCGAKGNIFQLAKLFGKTVPNNERGYNNMNRGSVANGQTDQESKDAIKEEKVNAEKEARIEAMLKDAAEFYHRQFMAAKDSNLADEYLLSKKIARRLATKYKVGWANKDGLFNYLLGKKYTLQEMKDCGLVREYGSKVVDVFRDSIIFPILVGDRVVYLLARQLAEGAKPKYLNIKRTIKWLYNEEILSTTNKAIIVEGVPDSLTLIDHNYPVVGTLGAGLFKDEFVQKFVHVQHKYVCLDNDLAGFNGMEKIDELFGHDIKVIALPAGVKDINEFFQNHSKEDFDDLIKKAKRFENYALDQAPAKEIHLTDIEASENIHKRVKVTFRVAGVGAVYFVPIRFRAHYKEEESETIQSRDFIIPQNNSILMKMCKESKDAQLGDCRKFAKSHLCSTDKIEHIDVLDYISMTQILAIPKIKELKVGASGELITEEGKEFRQKVALFQGTKKTAAKLYNATGYVVADPLTSEARFLVSGYEEIREEFDKFRLTPEIMKQFEAIKRKDNESIDDYLDKLAESAAYHFIRIYGEPRKDAIIASLICYHSPLYFYYEGELINGWLQILYIGDTTTGKSQIPKRIRNYVDIGVYVTGETCSRTGFLYAIDTKTLSTNILTTGLLVQQDRSILIIDGANYISREDWGTAREARRSGRLIIERIVKGEYPCRPRLILAANPSKPLNQFIYPIEAIKDIFEEPDIARLDLCVCFGGSDVPKEEINVSQEERDKPEMDMNPAALRNSIFWAWSRKPEDIVINADVVAVINSVANSLIDKFGSAGDIPLIGNDVKFKVVRLSAALACILHSTDKKHEKVLITPEIVQMVERFIVRVYSASNCRFDQYAADRKSATDITSDEFISIQRALADEVKRDRSNILTEMIGMFRSNNIIRLNEISARLDKSDSTVKSKLVFFKRFGLIRSGKSGYAKTEKFIQFLNKLELEKKALPSLPPYGKATPQQ